MKVLLVNCALIVLLLVALEVVLTVFRPIGTYYIESEAPGWRWKDSPYRTAILMEGRRGGNFWEPNETNQLGLRGQDIIYDNDTRVVLLVGDSQIEAPTSRREEMPERILEQALNKHAQKKFKVFSIAASGWSQDQQLLALQEYFTRFRADLVLLWHTPANDFWENAFPDRSTTSASQPAGHLKPVFALAEAASDDVELFEFGRRSPLVNVMRRSNVGRGVLVFLSRVGFFRFDNDAALRQWLDKIPTGLGHSSVEEAQCPTQKVPVWKFVYDYDQYAGGAVTLESDEAIEESRSHLTPFLETLSPRDKYAKQITRALLKKIKRLAETNGAKLQVFAPEFKLGGKVHFSEARCVVHRGAFFRINPDLLAPITEWKDEVNFEKVPIEIAPYGMSSITVDRRSDAHLNFFGNKLVMEKIVDMVNSQ